MAAEPGSVSTTDPYQDSAFVEGIEKLAYAECNIIIDAVFAETYLIQTEIAYDEPHELN